MLPGLNVPAGQPLQLADPCDAANVPGGHAVQLPAPADEYWPATQTAQDCAPPLLYSPGLQLEQFVDPVVAVYVPALQLVHAPLPTAAEYFPVGHTVHDDAPAAEYHPAGHAVVHATVEPEAALYFPAVHALQIVAEVPP